MYVFPAANLPGRAAQWGRAVEGEIRSIDSLASQSSQSWGNWNRAASGQLAVIGERLSEISYRSSLSTQIETLSVTGSATSEPFPRLDRLVTFPATPGSRQARVVLSGNVSESPSTSSRLYVYLLFNGTVIGADQIQPVVPNAPSEWSNNWPALVVGTLTTQSNVPTEITVRIVRGADSFTPGSSTMTLESPILTLSQSGESS